MAKKRKASDLWKFVLTATGQGPGPDGLSMIDVYDNLILEAERLESLETMLSSYPDSEIGTTQGLALLIGDIRRRMQVILELAWETQEVGKARGKVGGKVPQRRRRRDEAPSRKT